MLNPGFTGSGAFPAYLAPLRDALADARQRRRTIAAQGMPVPRNDEDAYAVQEAVAHACGWFASSRPAAWKVGAASRDTVPNAAPLPPRHVVQSPTTFAAGTFNRILIEGEIAFRLVRALDHAVAESAVDSIGEWLVTIEIVDPRYADFEAASPTQRLADQGLHGALVVGTGGALPPDADWSGLVARLRCNGKIVRETRGGHPLGDVRYLVSWLARHAVLRGMPLSRGDIVTAGTWTGVFEAFPGQMIDVEFDGIGHANVQFE